MRAVHVPLEEKLGAGGAAVPGSDGARRASVALGHKTTSTSNCSGVFFEHLYFALREITGNHMIRNELANLCDGAAGGPERRSRVALGVSTIANSSSPAPASRCSSGRSN